jgi:hypothetical protein
MTLLQSSWLKLSVISSVAAVCLNASAAELRTSAGSRPVSRTVAPASYAAPMAEEVEFEASGGADSYNAGGCGSGGCSSGGCSSCSGGHACGTQICQSCCFQSGGLWVNAEFLLAWRHGNRFPPLVTTSPNGTLDPIAGVLGFGTTSVAYSNEAIGEDARPGGRITLGTWLDPWQCWGVEGRYYALADETTQFTATSEAGDPILARPFFDVIAGAQASRLIAFPGIVSPGSVSVTTESEVLGGDALLRRSLCRWGCGRVDFIVGYQYARIDESLAIADSSTDVDPNNLIADGTIFAITDNFATRNEYHAATVGAAAQFEQGAWRLDVLGKIGFGNMAESVTIAGQTIIDAPPVGVVDVVNDFGLLAQGVNLGTFSQDRFAVSPEVNAKAVYCVNDCIDVWAGYTFVYWSRVAQPGQQIDIDLRVPADRFAIRDSEYWIHALTLGGQVRF